MNKILLLKIIFILNIIMLNFSLQYVDELNNIPVDKINSKLDEYYKTLSNQTFFNIITTYYKDLDKDSFVQKLISLYKKYPIDILIETINNTYTQLSNFVNFGDKKYKLNCLVSKLTADTKFFSNNSNSPSGFDLRNDLLGVRDQGPYGISVGFALAGMKEFQEIKEKHYTKYLSPLFIYLLRPDLENNLISPKDALAILKTKGICTESELSYVNINSTITNKMYENAKQFTINDYAYVTTINDLKMAINQNGPCIIEFPCFNNGRFFWKKNSNNEKLLGGHCVLAVGYDATRGFLIRNSWGENWNEFGYTWFPFEDWGCQNEVWTSINSLIINNIDDAPIIPITSFPPIKAISIANSSSLLSPIKSEIPKLKEIKHNFLNARNILIFIILVSVVFIIFKFFKLS